MTREEAIHVLTCGSWWDLLSPEGSDADLEPLHEALDVALSALSEKQNGGWISVKDMLPEDRQEVLIISSMGTVNVGEYREKEKVWGEHGLGRCFWVPGKHITHWQPLPGPPKGE